MYKTWGPVAVLALAIGWMILWEAPKSTPSLPVEAATNESHDNQPAPTPLPESEERLLTKELGSLPTLAAASHDESTEAALREMMRRDFSGLQEVQREDGGASLSLQGRFMHMSAVVIGPDGQPRVQCYVCVDELLTATNSPAPPHPSQ